MASRSMEFVVVVVVAAEAVGAAHVSHGAHEASQVEDGDSAVTTVGEVLLAVRGVSGLESVAEHSGLEDSQGLGVLDFSGPE